MAWLPDGEKKFDDMFIRFDTTHERDKQTDTQTPRDGKNYFKTVCVRSSNNIKIFKLLF